MRPIPDKPEHKALFWSKVNLDGPGGCYVWEGGVSLREGRGYISARPVFLIYDKGTVNFQAHRVAFAYERGRWPEKIRHTCHNVLCVNVDHMEELIGRESRSERAPASRDREIKLYSSHRERINSFKPYLAHCKCVGCHNFAVTRSRSYPALYCSRRCNRIQKGRDHRERVKNAS